MALNGVLREVVPESPGRAAGFVDMISSIRLELCGGNQRSRDAGLWSMQ